MRYIFFLFLFILFSCKTTINTNNTPPPPPLDKGFSDCDKDGIFDKVEIIRASQDYPPIIEESKVVTKVKSKTNKTIKTNKVPVVQPKQDVKPRGLIAYSVPDQMEVGQEYSVKVRISKQNDRTVLLVGDREIPISDNLDSVKVESITVSPIMSASLLSSKKDFEIIPLSTDIQNIEENGYTEWEWNVSPLQGGENNLKLNVKIRIKEDGNDYYKDITVFERKIKVKSNLGSSIKDFVFNNWEWFMGAIFIPLFQWLWLLWKRKKEEKDV